jgi:tRNA(Ile)-lysidine synthase
LKLKTQQHGESESFTAMNKPASQTVVALRNSVKACLDPGTESVVVGLSGGADSLVLTAIALWVGERAGFAVHAVVVDHGLQIGSRENASNAAIAATTLGATSIEIRTVDVGTDGGMEMAARTARRAALLDAAAGRPILLGHTANDQAETVLLRLLRGSGSHSLSAMSACTTDWHRPFLSHPRGDIELCVQELLIPIGITPWQDPHNFDEGFSRVKMRKNLDTLSEEFGPSIVSGLVRTADMLRADDQALDEMTRESARSAQKSECSISMSVMELANVPAAIRTRLIKLLFDELIGGTRENSPLTYQHVMSVETLISAWSGQGETALPLGVSAKREYGRLSLTRETKGAVRGLKSH